MSQTMLESYIEKMVRQAVTSSLSNQLVTNEKIKPIVVANWKMNMNLDSISEFVYDFSKTNVPVDVVICPPAPYLYVLNGWQIKLNALFSIGAQNVHSESKGAFTGDVSAEQLVDVGCEYVIIGHSERRAIGETNSFIHQKVKHALNTGLIPILCVGESEEERKQQKTNVVVEEQILSALQNIQDISRVIIAYEPVWAIGTGQSAAPEQAQEVHHFIRSVLSKHFGVTAGRTPILYGGSAKPENAKEFSAMADINGLLVGGASLKAGDFSKIIQAFC
ncbi:triose-phosphate isomerase [Neobacillus sp. D3-1R]|uniref:triose-phosphate isomerase n=1 Tax=Neobacillus sp. D3-1R TaxID=3445778 RepID=UPI003F9FC5DE